MRRIVALVVLVAACGGGQDDAATSPLPTSSVATATSTLSEEPPGQTTLPPATASTATELLSTYAFSMQLGVQTNGAELELVGAVNGEAMEPYGAVRLAGSRSGTPIDLAFDGSQWWDLEDPGLALTAAEVDEYLLVLGFLQPFDIAPLLADEAEWKTIGTELLLGVDTTHFQRLGIVKDVDWGLGDVATMDVWLESSGEVARLAAYRATGDNAGFPVSIWEITGRNVPVVLPQPP